MSKVIFTADIHFGVPGRLEDTIFACRVIDEYCRQMGIDTVVVLGDMFHDRRTLEIDVLAAVTNFLENAQQRWITFPGNHDMFLRHSWDITSLIPLRKHLTLIDNVKILKLDDRRFWVLPFIQLENAYMRVVRKIEEKFEEGDNLLTHIGVCGAVMNTCFLLKDWSLVSFENTPFNRIYTGHFHSKQQVGTNVWYPGSLIPFKFDEGDVAHGFYVYDTEENTHKFINIWKAAAKIFPNITPPPQFMTVLDTNISKLTEEDVKNNMIRIGLEKEYSANEKNEMRNHLLEIGAKAVRWLNLAQNIIIKQKEKTTTFENRNLFKVWVENDDKGTKDLNKEILNDIHNEIIVEGDERYTIEETED